jgi:hypothetical protein
MAAIPRGGGAVGIVHFKNPALLLGECRLSDEHRKEQRARCRESSQTSDHFHVPPSAFAGSPRRLVDLAAIRRTRDEERFR